MGTPGVRGVKKGRWRSKRMDSAEPGFSERVMSGLESEEDVERRGLPKPIEPFETRDMISLLRPMKAPVQMKRMLSVRMVYVSPFCEGGVPLAEPEVGDDLASGFRERSDLAWICRVVPSMILSNACWTPSPLTSLPCAGLEAAILSISSRHIIPCSAASTS